MAKQTINIGSAANDRTGSTLRAAMDICNDNFTELYLKVQYIDLSGSAYNQVNLEAEVGAVDEVDTDVIYIVEDEGNALYLTASNGVEWYHVQMSGAFA